MAGVSHDDLELYMWVCGGADAMHVFSLSVYIFLMGLQMDVLAGTKGRTKRDDKSMSL